jgi:hypothetical protein
LKCRAYGDVSVGFSKGSHCRTETVTRSSDADVADGDADASATLTKILYCVPPDAWNGFQV